jgi:hypothetical protein
MPATKVKKQGIVPVANSKHEKLSKSPKSAKRPEPKNAKPQKF